MKVLLALLALFTVAQGQVVIYGGWSTCDSNCLQNRTVLGCAGSLCNNVSPFYPYGDANKLGLTVQSCTGGACPAGTALPTNWQGVYSVKPNRCQPGAVPAPYASAVPPVPRTSTCCCMNEGFNVFVRQYDELVEFTFPEGVTMSGAGCYVPSAAGLPISESVSFFPKGVSFKTVNPDAPGGVNAGTYVNGALAKSGVTNIPNSSAPSTIKSAGTLSLFGRTYRAILTANSIFFFGLNGFSATDNPLCVQELNKIADLASY